MSVDLSHLKRKRVVQGEEEETVIPCLAITLYSEVPVLEIAAATAQTIKKYFDYIPPKTLRSCWIDDKTGKLTTRRINRDLQTLEKIPKYYEFFELLYSQGESGPPGTHGIRVKARNLCDEMYDTEVNLLRLELPWESAEGDQLDHFLSLLADIVNIFPFSVGNAGFAFSYWKFDRFGRDEINAMIPRYWGFDPSFESCCDVMKGKTPSAHWINLLSDQALEALGGQIALETAVPGADVRPVKGGIMVRAAKLPPVADINSGAPDIGLLPYLARFMRPTRFRISNFGGTKNRVDVDQWLERFDDFNSSRWDNR